MDRQLNVLLHDLQDKANASAPESDDSDGVPVTALFTL